MHEVGWVKHIIAKFEEEAFGQLEVVGDQEIKVNQSRRAQDVARGVAA